MKYGNKIIIPLIIIIKIIKINNNDEGLIEYKLKHIKIVKKIKLINWFIGLNEILNKNKFIKKINIINEFIINKKLINKIFIFLKNSFKKIIILVIIDY